MKIAFIFFLFLTQFTWASTWVVHIQSHMTQQLMKIDNENIDSDIYQNFGLGFFNSRPLFWKFNWEWGANYSPRKFGVEDETLEYKNMILPIGIRLPIGLHSLSMGLYYSQSFGEATHSEQGSDRLDQFEYKNYGHGQYFGYSYRWLPQSIIELRFLNGMSNYSMQSEAKVDFNEYQIMIGYFFSFGGSNTSESSEGDVPDIDLGDLE